MAPAYATIALLLLAAFLPRALMAWKVDILTEDGPTYIYAALQLERGNYQAAFRDSNLGLNLYPAILAGLHQLGMPWELGGRMWGTLMATLVVLPMFGCVRRQFDDRTAVIACLLYAAHPGLLERSPELLRCPTFWLLLMSTVYFLWRAVREERAGWFLAAGVCFTLGVHLRIEMWFVLVPWLLWTLGQLFRKDARRSRLMIGCTAGLLLLPALTVLLNITVLRHQPQWEWCLAQRMRTVNQLLWPNDPAPAHTAQPASDSAIAAAALRAPAEPVSFLARGHVPRPSRSATGLVMTYLRRMVDAIDPIFGALLLCGLFQWRRSLWRYDQLVMLLYSLVCLASVVAFWWLVHDMQARYFFPIVLISTGYAAGGVAALSAGLMSASQRLGLFLTGNGTRMRRAIVAGVLIIGCGDALTNNYDDRLVRRELGEWIRTVMGPGQSILGSDPRGWALAYYAQSQYYGPAAEQLGTPEFQQHAGPVPPSVVIVTQRRGPADESPWYRQFQADGSLAGQFRAVPAECLPASARHALVLVRAPDWTQAVERASRAPLRR